MIDACQRCAINAGVARHAHLYAEVFRIFGMNLNVRMRIRIVQSLASTSLGPRVEMQMVSSSRQVVRVFFTDSVVWHSIVTRLEDGTTVRVHHSVLLGSNGRSRLQIVSCRTKFRSGSGMAKREIKIPLTERLGIIRLGHENAIGILV